MSDFNIQVEVNFHCQCIGEGCTAVRGAFALVVTRNGRSFGLCYHCAKEAVDALTAEFTNSPESISENRCVHGILLDKSNQIKTTAAPAEA